MNTRTKAAKRKALSTAPLPDPLMESITNFFATYNLQECQTQIWNLAIGYIESPHNEEANTIEKSNTLHFCKGIDLMLRILHMYNSKGV